jgi:hypothetical protein
VSQDPEYVKDGMVTPKGLAAMKARMPHANFTALEQDPQVRKVAEIFTVEVLVRFVEAKLAAK